MPERLFQMWSYLATTPLLGLTLTMLVYLFSLHIFKRCKGHALANPVLISVACMALILTATGISYPRYFEGAQFVHFLLGPATVALALPLYAQVNRVKRMALPAASGLLIGSLVAIVSAMVIAWGLKGSWESVLSLAPKSVTTPIAMGIAEQIGGLPSLTAVLVILTGIVGTVIMIPLFKLLNIQDDATKGVAIGVAAHGIGTARAFQISEQAGAFSALAMGVNGLLTAILVPTLLPWIQNALK